MSKSVLVFVFIPAFMMSCFSWAASTEGNRLLNQAIFANDVSAVKQTLTLKVDVNEKSEQGIYAIHAAMKPEIKDEILALVLSAKARPDVRNVYYQTPLHVAVAQGSVKKAQLLLAAGADVNLVNASKDSPLHLAAGGTGINSDPQISYELTRLILATGKVDFNLRNRHELTPLIASVLRYTPSARIAQALLDAGADPSVMGLGQNKALDFAASMLNFFKKNPSFGEGCIQEQEKIVQLLRSTGR